MKCHDPSCSVCVRRMPDSPFVHIAGIPAWPLSSRSPFIPFSPPPSGDGGVRGGSWKTPCIVSCFVMFPCRRRSSAVAFLHIVPPSRSVRSMPSAPPPVPAPRRRDPFCARILPAPPRGRAGVGAGAVRAPDCARDDGRTSPVASRRGFFRPQPLLPSAEERKGGPKEPPLCHHCRTLSHRSSPLAGEI